MQKLTQKKTPWKNQKVYRRQYQQSIINIFKEITDTGLINTFLGFCLVWGKFYETKRYRRIPFPESREKKTKRWVIGRKTQENQNACSGCLHS